jgi:hypothetical protein
MFEVKKHWLLSMAVDGFLRHSLSMQELPEAKGHDLHLSPRDRLSILAKAIRAGKVHTSGC